jgi:hypothetical protein
LHFYSKIWRKTISNRGSSSKISPRARPPRRHSPPRACAGPSVFEPPARLPRSPHPLPTQLAPSPHCAHAEAAWNAAPPWSLRLPAVPAAVPLWSLPCLRCPLSFSLPHVTFKGHRSLLDAKDPSPLCTAPALAGNGSRGGRSHWPPARRSPVPPPPCPTAPTVPLASPRVAATAGYRALAAATLEQPPPRPPLPGRGRAARRSHLRLVQTPKSGLGHP